MRVALVHDYIKEYGGAERVLESLHEIFPEATVYTSLYLPSYLGPHEDRFREWNIQTSWAQFIPFKAKLISPLRLLSPLLFKQFDFSGYDVIITSATGAYFPNSLKKRKAKLLCYCHTPPRYLYGYATAREWKKNRLLNAVGEIANHFLRLVDFTASKNVDQYIANSEEVKRRIEKFYRQEAKVIYPPIQMSSKYHGTSSKQKMPDTKYIRHNTEFYVAGGRLARPKHIDLIIRACREADVPLKIFGKAFAGYGEELRELANGKWQMENGKKIPLIEFVGEVTDEEKWELLSGAKAYLFASEDEDFGILPVEAMAAGTPVIAYRSGGVQESVIEGETGLFFNELTVASLQKAIKEFERKKFSKEIIKKRASEFSEKAFQEKILKLVKSTTASK